MKAIETIPSLQELLAAIEATSNGVVLVDCRQPDMPISFVNSGFERLTGYSRAEAVGRNCRFLQGPDTDRDSVAVLHRAVAEGRPFTARLLNYRKDGSMFWNELIINPIHDENSTLIGFVGVQNDVTAEVTARREIAKKIRELEVAKRSLDAANAELQRIAYFDPLTELPTRWLFQDRLTRSLQRSKRTGEMVAIAFLDLDGFKHVNDTFGHEVGDVALRQVAERIRGRLRETDTLARLGGDEFVVLLDTPVSQDILMTICDRITRTFATPFILAGSSVYLGVSIGTAFYPDDGETAQCLMRFADAAMYRSKTDKRSQIAPRAQSKRAALI